MRPYKDILSKLVQSKLFITREALQAELAHLYTDYYFDDDIPTYSDKSEAIAKKLSSDTIHLTTRFHDTNIEEVSIALHRIAGTIYSEYDDWGYYFSTRQFVDDLQAAEENQNIAGHLVMVESGGGDAYFLDVAAAKVKSLQKPSIGLIEGYCCSAALYLTCYLDKLYANTPFDTIGSIGTMMAFWDIKPFFEEMGLKWHEHYAEQSKLKNKKFNDLLEGKPQQIIKEELNPLAAEFIRTVKDARPGTAKAPEAVFQGETYYTPEAIKHGLIDGQLPVESVITGLMDIIGEDEKTQSRRESMLNLI